MHKRFTSILKLHFSYYQKSSKNAREKKEDNIIIHSKFDGFFRCELNHKRTLFHPNSLLQVLFTKRLASQMIFFDDSNLFSFVAVDVFAVQIRFFCSSLLNFNQFFQPLVFHYCLRNLFFL
jgi:hypothetical protein